MTLTEQRQRQMDEWVARSQELDRVVRERDALRLRVQHLDAALKAAKICHNYCSTIPDDGQVFGPCDCGADAHNAALTKALESEG